MIKAVVFDLDHTLFDRYATLRALMPSFVKNFKVNKNKTIDELSDIMVYADKNFVHMGWQKILEYLAANDFFEVVPEYEVYTETLLREFMKNSVEFPFTKPMFNELREMGLKIALITNGRSEIQRTKIKNLGFEDCFDEIIVSGEFGKNKPDPSIFLEMAKRLSLEPSELVYVGDDPRNDVDGSRNAGYTPIWVKTVGKWVMPDIARCQYEVDDVSEIPELIKEINNK